MPTMARISALDRKVVIAYAILTAILSIPWFTQGRFSAFYRAAWPMLVLGTLVEVALWIVIFFGIRWGFLVKAFLSGCSYASMALNAAFRPPRYTFDLAWWVSTVGNLAFNAYIIWRLVNWSKFSESEKVEQPGDEQHGT